MAIDPAPSQKPRPPPAAGPVPPEAAGPPPTTDADGVVDAVHGHPFRARLATAGARAALEVEDVLIGLAKFPSP